MKCYLKNGMEFYEAFTPNIGVGQGDSMAAILFALFLADLGECIPNLGPMIYNQIVSFILYADDICLMATSAEDLQKMLAAFEDYCTKNNLKINVRKSKIMIFHRGRLPKKDAGFHFKVYGQVMEQVKVFKYLGFQFTSQMNFASHIGYIMEKARSRIGFLMAKVDLRSLDINVVLQIFGVYVTPIFDYGLPLWASGCSKSNWKQIDAIFTKFLKFYLGLPKFANNKLVYFLTQTVPLSNFLQERAPNGLKKLMFPSFLDGFQLSYPNLLKSPDPFVSAVEFPPWVPWITDIIKLSSKFDLRRKFARSVSDIIHYDLCKTSSFHPHPCDSCICVLCDAPAVPYHYLKCANYDGS